MADVRVLRDEQAVIYCLECFGSGCADRARTIPCAHHKVRLAESATVRELAGSAVDVEALARAAATQVLDALGWTRNRGPSRITIMAGPIADALRLALAQQEARHREREGLLCTLLDEMVPLHFEERARQADEAGESRFPCFMQVEWVERARAALRARLASGEGEGGGAS